MNTKMGLLRLDATAPHHLRDSATSLPPPRAEGSPLMAVKTLYVCSFSACRKMKVLAKADRTRGRGIGRGAGGKFSTLFAHRFIIKNDFSAEKSTRTKKSFPAREMIARAIAWNSVRHFPKQQALYRTNE